MYNHQIMKCMFFQVFTKNHPKNGFKKDNKQLFPQAKTPNRFLAGPSLLEKILSDASFSERDAAAVNALPAQSRGGVFFSWMEHGDSFKF